MDKVHFKIIITLGAKTDWEKAKLLPQVYKSVYDT